MDIEKLRSSLAENDSMMKKSLDYDDNLKRHAEDELSRVDVRLQSMPYGHVAHDSATAYEYRRLLAEKARLLNLVAGDWQLNSGA